MKNRVCYLAPALAALLVQLSLSAHAFTLGNLRGAAVLGRPLDVTVQVRAGSDEVLSSTCVTAEVFYADARQSAVKVTVLPVADVTAGSAVRVQSSAAIDEPVVTVEVRANCGSSTLRRYVLLADFPALAVATAVPLSVPGAAEAVPVLVLPTPAPSGQGVAVAPAKPLPNAAIKPPTAKAESRQASVKPRKTPAVVATAAPTLAPKAVTRVPGKSVLKLDPLDLLSDRIDALDSAMLFAPTEDALRYSRQISTLEGDVKTLRALAASNDAKLSDLTAKLQQAQASQIPLWLIYGLVVLVLACLAAMIWLWQQQQRRLQKDAAPSWWHGPEEGALTELLPQTASTAPAPMPDPAQPVKPSVPAAVAAPLPTTAPAASMVQVDIDLDHVMPLVPMHGSFDINTAGVPFELNSIRHISVEPILDIRQQAEFFVSLGQTDRALHILKKQMAESLEPNPLVYLDLITLYHALGMKADFRECRDTFHQLFSGNIPDFPSFKQEGHDLEAYPDVLTTLVPLWPRMEALAFLSACIFHDEKTQPRCSYDLAAFRDLLLLHALVEVLVTDQPARAEASLATVSMPQVAAAQVPELVEEPLTASTEGSVSRLLDLDFSDLSDFPLPPKKA